jgi:cbb3-type cytochrome oxidase subunit 3
MWRISHISLTILLAFTIIGLILWIFRADSKNYYEEKSRIPLKEDDKK